MAVNPDWAACGRCDCVAGVSPIPRKFEIPGVMVTQTCPRRLMIADAEEIARLYGAYKAGHLLIAGGIFDQPAAYIEVMSIVQTWSASLTPTH